MGAPSRHEIRFILNDEEISTGAIRPDETLLDFLRLRQRLTGTKEGCAEGDCGACTVLVGRIEGDSIAYESVNACIRFVGSLDGCHVVTVEHLSAPGSPLAPIQQAMVDHHGSQCGFCTPGIVMSLQALWMSQPEADEARIETALQGNLCRCTGYEPIVRAAEAALSAGGQARDRIVAGRAAIIARLKALADGRRVEIDTEGGRLAVPADLDDFAALYASSPEATVVAGATDVGLWVTKRFRPIAPVLFIGGLSALRTVSVGDNGALRIGAGVSYSQLRPIVAASHPELAHLIERIGGEQVRNMGTIGGNIANGSPIGDMPPALIALGATVELRHGDRRRSMPLDAFFIAYGKQDRAPGEFVEALVVPPRSAGTLVGFHKISKRRDEDITSVLGAFAVTVDKGIVVSARIAYGGMAATPKRASAVEAALTGKPWTRATVESAMARYADDFAPISDMRASAAYRLTVAANLLKRFHLETTGDLPVTVHRREVA